MSEWVSVRERESKASQVHNNVSSCAELWTAEALLFPLLYWLASHAGAISSFRNARNRIRCSNWSFHYLKLLALSYSLPPSPSLKPKIYHLIRHACRLPPPPRLLLHLMARDYLMTSSSGWVSYGGTYSKWRRRRRRWRQLKAGRQRKRRRRQWRQR